MAMWTQIRAVGRGLRLLVIALVLLALGNSPAVYSPLDLAVAPYEFRLVQWELANLPDKWWHRMAQALPWASGDQTQDAELLHRFTALAEQLRAAKAELDRAVASGFDDGPAQARIGELQRRMDALSPRAQAAMESQVAAVLKQEGLGSLWGGVFPPVDVVFTSTPLVLVVSPRDRIERQDSFLLNNRMTVSEMEGLETRILEEQDLAALVLRAGGLASYPSMVDPNANLHHLVAITVHEWLHQYWFFRPLGRNYFANSTMTTLNETAADLAGDELGAVVYQAITGEAPPGLAHPADGSTPDDPEVFAFNREMRATRLEVDRLLAEGSIGEAESFMEERRLVFVQNGYYLRKLNQAYFAFHGSYGSSPASTSPIQGQVERVRLRSASVGQFVRTMSQFGTYAEFEEYVAGLPPVPLGMDG